MEATGKSREPRSPLRDELEFYFVQAKAYGVRDFPWPPQYLAAKG